MLQEKMMNFALLGAEWVMWLLVILSVVCLAIAFERGVYLFLNRSRSDALSAALSEFLKTGELGAFRERLDKVGGVEARVLAAGVEAAETGTVGAAEEAIAGTLIFERMKLDRGLIVLGTTGSNAPFVGLFGTVLGIIKAFHDLALSQAGAMADASKNTAEAGSAVMAGISEALVATAIGLMVAIPAVVLYNFFQRVIKSTLGRTESLAHVVLGRIKGRAPAEA
jgi:biopolymer transport protein ExbB